MDSISPPDIRTVPSTGPQLAKQPSFTTVGSVYNPSASTPLQPPARLGRTLRWPPQPQSDLALLPKEVLSGFPLKISVPRSPPTTASSLQQYSPLQQNYDRAVSPVTDQERDALLELGMAVPNMAPGSKLPTFLPPGLAAPTTSNKHGHANIDDDDDEDFGPEEKLASQFNVKTLTNLASFPNPMRGVAQKTLARARPALSTATNVAREPVTAKLSHTTSDLTRDCTMPPTGLRSTASDPRSLTALGVQAEERPRGGLVHGYTRTRLPGRQQPSRRSLKQGPNGMAPGSSAFGTLSTGPGAPQPLTAGPPGQRQYKASTFEATIKALEESAHKSSRPAEDETAQSDGPHPVSYGRPSGVGPLQPKPITPSKISPLLLQSEADRLTIAPPNSSNQATLQETLKKYTSRIRETQPTEAVHQYYPHGFPHDYGRNFEPISHNWTEEYPIYAHMAKEKSPEELAMLNANINAAWYAGTDGLGKSVDNVIRDAERRHFVRTMGITENEHRHRRLQLETALGSDDNGKPTYPPLSIEDAGGQSTSVHAEPLLTMAFASLLSYYENDQRKGRLSGFETPDPWLIDNNTNEKKSFWSVNSQAEAKKVELKKRSRRV